MPQPLPEMPQARNGFVPTLNRQGFMSTRPDAYMEAFIAFAKTSPAPVVDIGAAYGVATIPALEAGANVIAVDVDAEHLEILRHRVPSACSSRLQTMAASFPEELRFEPNSIGAFLASQVVHFLSPDRLETAAARLFEWLIPDGKVFVTAASPYLGNLIEFMAEYDARKRAGEAWPGYVIDAMKYAPEPWLNPFLPVLLLEPEILSRVFRQAGFVVEKADFIARPELPPQMQMDGREGVGLIARKPAG